MAGAGSDSIGGMPLTPVEAYDLATALSRAVVDGDGDRGELLRTVDALSGRELLVLDQAARTYRHRYATPVAGVRGWLDPRLNETDGFVAIVTSMHVDGRFRERAVGALGDVGEPAAVAAIAVRLLDHVPEIREAARKALLGVDVFAHLERIMDVVLAGRDRRFGSEAVAFVEQCALDARGEVRMVSALMASPLRLVRRHGIRRAHRAGLLRPVRLREIVRAESDQLILAWCADWLLESRDSTGLGELLSARSAMIRQIAVLAVDDATLANEQLLALTVDRVARVRESARFRARRRGLDVADWYRATLSQDLPGRTRAAALDGLLVIGGASDLPTFIDALSSDTPRVREVAVRGVFTWAARDDALRRLRALLTDPSSRVSSAAARALGRLGAPAAFASEAWSSEHRAHRRAAWLLARSGGGWDQVEADLRLSGDEDVELAGLGRAQLSNWLEVRAATTWQPLSSEQRDRIAAELGQWDASSDLRRSVEFHAGIKRVRAETPIATRPEGLERRRWWQRR